MSNSLRPNGLQHIRLPCPSLSPRVCSYSCPLSQWYYLTISSSAALFSSCPQSFPASGSFPMSRLFASDGQSTWSFSFSISPSNEYWGLISFRIDCFDPLGVWRTHKSLLQLSALPERVSALFLLVPLCGTLTLHYIHFVLGGSIQSTLKSEVCCFWYWNSGGAGGPLLYLILLLLLRHFSRVRLCETPWTTAYQAPPSMGFSRQEYWSGLPLPSPSNPSHAFIPDCNFC